MHHRITDVDKEYGMTAYFADRYMSGEASAKNAEASTCCAYHLIAVILGAAIAASILILLCFEVAPIFLLMLSGTLIVYRVILMLNIWNKPPRANIPSC